MTAAEPLQPAPRLPIRGAVLVLADRKSRDAKTTIAELEQHGHVVTRIDVPALSIDAIRSTLGALAGAPLPTLGRMLRHPFLAIRSIHLARELDGMGVAHVHSLVASAITNCANVDCSRGALTPELLRRIDARPAGKPETLDQILSLDWHSLGATSLAIRRLHDRAGSIIAELTLDDGREVVLKTQRQTENEPRPPGESARIEYTVLNSLHRGMTTTLDGVTYSVPRALLLDVPRASVIMQRAAGTPLDRIVSAARRARDFATLERSLERAGTWLRLMQQSTRKDGDGNALLASFIDAAPADANVRAWLHSRRKEVGALPIVGQHGDLWPGNLFLSERSVEVIDFEGFRDGLPLEDAAYLLSYLELLPLAGRDYPRMERAFLAGFTRGEPLDRAALDLFRVLHAIRTLGRMSKEQSLRDRLVRRALETRVRRSIR
jgi:hypothetical protein